MSDVAVVILTAPPDASEPAGAMMKVDGRESVLRCMELFTNREGIAQTMVVVNKAQAEDVKRKIGSHLMFMGIKLVSGGATWWDQIADAHKAIKSEAGHVLVHDGARPAVSYVDLDSLLDLVGKHPAASLATPIKGTLVQATALPGPGKPADVKIAKLLSPMLFTRAGFDALAAAKKLPDPIHLVEGSALNVRCGTNDAAIVKAMIGLLPKPKVKAPSSPFEEAQW